MAGRDFPSKKQPLEASHQSISKANSPLSTRPFTNTQQETTKAPEAAQSFDFSQINISQTNRPIQPKLTIGEPGDKYEQEADNVAKTVVQQINNPQTALPRDHNIQRSATKQLPISSVQRDSSIPVGPASNEFESSLNQARKSGSSLAPKLQTQMGSAMGADFSQVKIHTDTQADQLSRSIQAKAFTTGQDVFFKQGAYNPDSRNGQELIAHELTHVMQQTGAGVMRSPDHLQRDTEPSEGVLDDPNNSRIEDIIESSQPQEEPNEVNTIKSSLKKAGKAYEKADATTLGIEKLFYAFDEDRKIVNQLPEGLTDTEVEEADTEINTKITSLDNKLTHSKQYAKGLQKQEDKDFWQLQIEEFEVQKFFLGQSLKYLGILKNKNANTEKETAENWTDKASEAMTEGYKLKSIVSRNYKQIQEYRAEFPESSDQLSQEKQQEKLVAKSESTQLASQAEEFSESIETHYKNLKGRKKELVKSERIAPEFSDNAGKWLKLKGWKKFKVQTADWGLGFVSAGIMGMKSDSDKRGFIQPAKVTNVIADAKEAFKKIKTERQALQAIQVRSKPAAFFDMLVSILQGLDRVILSGVKRVVKYIKIYCSALAAIPVLTPIFTPVTAALSIVSGVISSVRTGLNAMISSIRAAQAWLGDATVKNILAMSAIDASITGAFSGVKTLTFGLELDGTISEQEENIVDPVVNYTSKVSKPLVKEGAKKLNKGYKNYGKVVKGDLQGPFLDMEADDKTEMAQDSLQEVMKIMLRFTPDVDSVTDPIDDGAGKLDQANQTAESHVEDGDQQETLEGSKKASESLQVGGLTLKEVKDMLSK